MKIRIGILGLLAFGAFCLALPAQESHLESPLAAQLRELVYSNIALQQGHWFQLARWESTKMRTLPRSDLREVRVVLGQLRDSTEKILKVLAQAESEKVDLFPSVLPDPALTRPEFWRAEAKEFKAVDDKFGVIDQNWDDWVSHPFPENENELKPWQREVRRLDDEVAAAARQASVLAAAARDQAQSLLKTPTVAPGPVVNVNQITLKAHLSVYKAYSDQLNGTRWMQVRLSASGYKQISREDLREFDDMTRNVLASIDQVLGDLPASQQEPWRVRRALVSACSEQARLFEANWNEWHTSGVKPKEREAKPWQKEAMRLQSEIDAVEKRDKELLQKSR
jgi:hypothetical protein